MTRIGKPIQDLEVESFLRSVIEMRWKLADNSRPREGRLEMRTGAGTARLVNAPLEIRDKCSFVCLRRVRFVVLSNHRTI